MKGKRLKSICLAVLTFAMCFFGMASPVLAQTETIALNQGSITLHAPYEIKETMMYKDGGTIGIVVKDSKGVLLPLCYDQRIKVPKEDRFVYVGATHPDQSSATKVARGSKTERALFRVLTSAEIISKSPRIRKDLVQTVVEQLTPRRMLHFR